MLAVDRIIHAAHFIFGNFARELAERCAGLRVRVEHDTAHERHRFIRRKIAAVVLESDHSQSSNQAIR